MRPDLDAIRKRRVGITEPPWDYDDCGFVSTLQHHVCQTWGKLEEDFRNAEKNGIFIAAAPTDIDAMLEYVAELEGKLKNG